MSPAQTSPTPPSSDDGSEAGSSEAPEPRYTPQELGEIFLNFYQFLTTLHYDKSDLKIPHPDGWSEITPRSCANSKSEYATEVLRHLPYFDSKCTAFIHYKSRLLDFTAFTRIDFKRNKGHHEGLEFWSCEGEEVDPMDVVRIAGGRESYGRELWLNVNDCEIIEDALGADTGEPVKIEYYLESLKEAYQKLELIPCRDRITIEAEDIPERESEVTLEEVRAQTERWGTDLDIQYVRQIYRQHGWPEAFRKEEAFKVVEDWMETQKEEREEWEKSPLDWDTGRWP